MTDLPPGPELDRQVYEALRNWRPDGRHTCIGVIHVGNRSPSTNIAHAWEEVVEQMRTLGWRFEVQDSNHIGDSIKIWHPKFSRWPSGDRDPTVGFADKVSLPHAICLAALMALA